MLRDEDVWEKVLAARDRRRPYSLDYINGIFDWFMELHGDRLYGDDRAVVGGIAAIGKRYVTVIGHQKGRSVRENQKRNFGMANPEGYRKALRLMKQAEKFRRPVILFVDTPGAFCGVEAEERGQGSAIADNLYEMSALKVPVLSIVIGEGGSGGALAFAVANEVYMMENSVYSILSPEGFAAILWRDGKRMKEAAAVMKLTAQDLKSFGVIEEIIPEVRRADYEHMDGLIADMRGRIESFLMRYENKTEEQLCQERYERFRRMGNDFVIEEKVEHSSDLKHEKPWWDKLEAPIFQGGMGVGVSLGGLAGAVAACGGAGTIAAAQIGFREADFEKDPLKANLRAIGKEVKKAREISGGRGLVGINIMTATSHYDEYVKEAVKQDVDFIVSGAGLPMSLPSLTKGSDVRIIPIVSSLRAVSVICKRWLKKENRLPDAVIVEGAQAGGHLGFSAEEAAGASENKDEYRKEIVSIIDFLRNLGEEHKTYIPVITAGGYNTREDIREQLELGADAVQIATLFVTTEECDASDKYKEAYINCKKEDISIVKSPVGMPGRAIRNEFIRKTEKQRIPPKRCYGCIPTCKPDKTPYCITEALINAVKGDTDNGLIFCGGNAWKANRISTVKEVIDSLV